jgi:predicted CoA-binding protein
MVMPDSTRPTERPRPPAPDRSGLNLRDYEGPKGSIRPERTQRTVAVVGASADRAKFGNKAVRAYLQDGYTVWPVNPKGGEIEGVKVYEDLSKLPEMPFLVAIYLHEDAAVDTLDSLSDLIDSGKDEPAVVYLPPGADHPGIVERARELGLFVEQECPIVAIGHAPEEYGDE